MAKTLSDSQRDEVNAEIAAGRLIQAIKLYREATGEGLKEAKDAVDAMQAESHPQAAAQRRSKVGCLGVVIIALAGIWACLY